jgi:NADH-quinone oxidoreductase subunit L
MLFLVFWGEPSPLVREHGSGHEGTREGPPEMFWPVVVLALLSVIGGWIQFAPFWTPVSDFLAPSAEPLVEATGTQELVSSTFGVLFGLGGIAAAWAFYGARRAPVPRVPQLQRALERKLWFDDLYDALFYRPAVWLSKALLRWVERLLIAGSISEVALGTRQFGRLAARIQTGLVRAYALALAGGLAVLVVVFISVR